MNKFKVGDKVIILDSFGSLLKVGDESTILEVHKNGLTYGVDGDHPGFVYTFYPDHLRLASDPAPSNLSYRSEVLRTANADDAAVTQRVAMNVPLLNAAMGLAGEAGEFADLVKKTLIHGKSFDKATAIKELGDIRWYLELAAFSLGVTLEEVERVNVEKLRARYPTGFTEAAANARADEQK